MEFEDDSGEPLRNINMKSNYILEILKELRTHEIPPEELGEKQRLAGQSFLEVQSLIRFEDYKASRILTAIAFLSGMFAAMYATLQNSLGDRAIDIENWSTALWLNNICFFLYLILVLTGVTMMVLAIRAKYNIPDPAIIQQTGVIMDERTGNPIEPDSYLFFEKIIANPPANWARAWGAKTSAELKRKFLENLIVETYVISLAVKRKYMFLKPGVHLICIGAGMFILWIITAVFVLISH